MKSHTVLKLKLVDAGEREQGMAELCRRAKNAGAENWLLRQRGLSETEKQSKRLCQHASSKDRESKSEATKIYHACAQAVPQLGSDIHSTLAQQIHSFLAARVDWRYRDEEIKRRRDAILSYQDRPPYFTELSIPVRNKNTTVHFADRCVVTVRNVIRGETYQFEVSLRGLTTGLKTLLHELASGERKLSDSQIIFRRNNWYWYVPVAFETGPVESQNVAELTPRIGEHQWGKFFTVAFNGTSRNVGDGNYLRANCERLIGLRKQIGWRYRQRQGAGHGRRKIDAAVRKRSRQLADIKTEVRRRLIVDVVRFCERHGCGIVRYREPTLPVRNITWLAQNGIEWDWTRFLCDLRNSLARRGIQVKKDQLKMDEAKGALHADAAL